MALTHNMHNMGAMSEICGLSDTSCVFVVLHGDFLAENHSGSSAEVFGMPQIHLTQRGHWKDHAPVYLRNCILKRL